VTLVRTQVGMFIQRKREVQLAVNLASKLQLYVDGEEKLFRDKIAMEAAELSECSLGASLLALIGSIYIDRAKAEMSVLGTMYVSLKSSLIKTTNMLGVAGNSVYMLKNAFDSHKFQQKMKAKEDAEDLKNEIPFYQRRSFHQANKGFWTPGPNNTPEEKADFRKSTQNIFASTLGVMWRVSNGDITSTLTNVCEKCLRDHSVTKRIIKKRCEALLILGQEFQSRGVPFDKSFEEFLTTMEARSGLFEDIAPTPTASSSNESAFPSASPIPSVPPTAPLSPLGGVKRGEGNNMFEEDEAGL